MFRLPIPAALRNAATALLPSSCALCGASGAHGLCTDCDARYRNQPVCRCFQCARPLPATADKGERCSECLQLPPAFDTTVIAIDYVAPLDQLVQELKFRSKLALAPVFAQLLCDAALQSRTGHSRLPDLLLAVPLGSARLKERGYNQAHEIAKPLGRALGVPVRHDLVRREKNTHAQALLAPEQRRENIRNAFVVTAAADVDGRHVGVVDDVITTGETLNALATALKHAGATQVTNFVFARTPPKKG